MRYRISIRGCVRPSVSPSIGHTRVETMEKCRFWPKLLSVPARTHLLPCNRPCFFHVLPISVSPFSKILFILMMTSLFISIWWNSLNESFHVLSSKQIIVLTRWKMLPIAIAFDQPCISSVDHRITQFDPLCKGLRSFFLQVPCISEFVF